MMRIKIHVVGVLSGNDSPENPKPKYLNSLVMDHKVKLSSVLKALIIDDLMEAC